MPRLPRLSLTRTVMVLAALAVGYFVFSALGGSLLSDSLKQDEQRLEREIQDLRRQEVTLEAIRDYLRTDEYIEGVARRLFGLVRPGETLVIVSSSATPVPTPEDDVGEASGLRWWEELYGP